MKRCCQAITKISYPAQMKSKNSKKNQAMSVEATWKEA
jgi:hypothetical protein